MEDASLGMGSRAGAIAASALLRFQLSRLLLVIERKQFEELFNPGVRQLAAGRIIYPR